MAKQLYTDQDLIKLLQTDTSRAIDLLFRMHYTYLCQSVYRILPNTTTAEDLVQDVFYELWKKKDNININTSIRAYLRRAARNKTLNYIRDQKMQFEDEENSPELESGAESSSEKLETQELQQHINKAIEALPERCRLVFSLSRYEEMTYAQIATSLGISIKTVENQISKALKLLRVAVSRYRIDTS